MTLEPQLVTVWGKTTSPPTLEASRRWAVLNAAAINDHNQIVGWSTTASGNHHAFLWQNGKMTDLGTLGGKKSEAADINNRGQIIGTSTTKSGKTHAVLWTLKTGS